MWAFLAADRQLDGDAWPVIERFLRQGSEWLPLPARVLAPANDDSYDALAVHLVVSVLRTGPALHPVAVEVGPPWALPDCVSRPVAWTPSDDDGRPVHTALLPGFRGRLTLRHGGSRLRLALEGSYEPPAGRIGAVADRVLMHRTGDRTARALLDDVATRLLLPSAERLLGNAR